MKTVHIPYGTGTLLLECPAHSEVVQSLPLRSLDVATTIRRALSRPIASKPLSNVVKRDESVAVLLPDATRHCPTEKMLHLVVDALEKGGADSITLVFGLGLHRKMTSAEVAASVGECTLECIQHDPEQCSYVGTTGRGTCVELFDELFEHDRVVAIGRIDYHYYAGYTGGYKALLPAVSSKKTIISNHSMMLEAGAVAGTLDGPVRADIDDVRNISPLDFVINLVGDTGEVVAGDGIVAHRMGCALLDRAARKKVFMADIVVVSAGGYPKDINLFQAHKAMEHVRGALKPGGVMILVAQCCEGLGNELFEQWAKRGYTPEEALCAFEKVGFEMGAHKLARLAKLSTTFRLYLVSDLSDSKAELCFFTPFDSVAEALESARAVLHKKAPEVLVVKSGSVLLEGVEP